MIRRKNEVIQKFGEIAVWLITGILRLSVQLVMMCVATVFNTMKGMFKFR